MPRRSLRLWLVIITFWLAVGVLAGPWRADAAEILPYISEFMASNTRTLADENREFSDWIEIHNPGSAPVNLEGWSLTDSAEDLARWRFPATNLAGGGFLVVFASEKNRRVPGAPLHTNFRLSASGEYLALVKPDGVTIVSEFRPEFSPQVPDVSYGRGVRSTETPLLGMGAPVRVLVPGPANGGDGLGQSWIGSTNTDVFDDSAWRSGTTGVGFAGGARLVASNALAVRFAFDAAPVGTTIVDSKPIGIPRPGVNAGATWAASSTDTAPTPHTRSGVMEFNAVEGDQIKLAARTEFNSTRGTICFWMRSAGASGPGSYGAILFDRRANTYTGPGDVIVMQDDGRLFVQAGNGSAGGINQFATSSAVNDNQWHHVAYVYDQTASGSIAVYVDGELAGQQNNATSWSWSSTQEIELGRSYDPFWRRLEGALDDFRIYNRVLTVDEIAQVAGGDVGVAPEDIGLDLGTEMLDLNASAFLRIPFVVQNPSAFSLLTLRLKYDDGYVAWINGVEVARANAPGILTWNSKATAPHAAGSLESFRLSNTPGLLHAGVNVLAIQGLNAAAADQTFLVLPELSATSVGELSVEGLYFTSPTPGAANSGGTTTPGPIITEVVHSPNVPLDDEDLTVTARVSPAFFPVANVTLRYRIMFGVEVNVPMSDDGGHGDGAAGDGVFGALIPASASTNGQMIRYYVSATDANGSGSRWPLFTAPADTAEYLGTIVDPTNVVSRLPIVHLFVNPSQQSAVDGDSGGRISVFYDGEFYDNVQMQVRGNTTAGYVKKSHRVEFNREHTFRHPGPGGRVRKTSFMAEFIDPAYSRQYLSFWLMAQAGHNSPYHYPVRLQNNGAFYQLAFHSEVLGEEQAARYGFDPRGVVYKAVGVLSSSPCSTGGGPEKISREEEPGQADYTALANAVARTLPVAVRRTNLFEHIDIPDLINYMAASRLSHEQDDIWANLSIYRDSDGDRLWRMLPFDLNLSWGQLYGDATVQATNDNGVSHPFYGASTVQIGGACGGFNHLQDAIIQVPETRQMFLRRLRTLMDAFLQPPGTPSDQLIIEREVQAQTNLFYPEAILDRQKWGWATGGGGPGALPAHWLTNGVRNLFSQFLAPRRTHLFVTHSITNSARALGLAVPNNAGIPLSQPANTTLRITSFDANPASHRQEQEYVCLSNPAPFAVDVSGWRLDGGIEFNFKAGTVVPAESAIYLSPDLNGFRSRTVSPHGGQGLFVVAPYHGQLSARGEELRVVNAAGQVVETFSYAGQPSLAQQYLRVTEIMYHPSPHQASLDPEDFEFLELKNISTEVTLDLSGARLTNGVDFAFAGSAITTLAPGARVLVVRNVVAFRARYGNGLPVAGQYTGALDNDGERLQLLDSNNEEILDFRFADDWYPITDGLGFSLVAVDEKAEPDAWGSRTQWRPSGALGGSPGANEPAPPTLPVVWITEALTRTEAPPPTDSIELHNPTGLPADISGWWLTDDFNTPQKFRIPDGTVLDPGTYRVFTEADFNAGAGFALSADGDEVWLFSAQPGGQLSGYVHGYQFGPAEDGVSFGRYVTSDNREHFVAQTARSLGSRNPGPLVGPLVINEIHYHPPSVDTNDNQVDEFVELLNTTGTALRLFDPAHPTNTWRVRGGVDFTLPEQVTLTPGEAILVVSFDPIADREAMDRFSAVHRLSAGQRVWGPYQGQLSNSGEELQLQKPTLLSGGTVAYVLVDEVSYRDAAPWPSGADGFGLSLQRRSPGAFGDDPLNWTAAAPTAGAPIQEGDDPPGIIEQPRGSTVLVGTTVLLSVQGQGPGLLRYQWQSHGTNLPGATNPSLSLANVQAEQAGDYRVVVYNQAGSVVSASALLQVLVPVTVLQQPRSVSIAPTSNVVFSVVAYGPWPIRYQWFKDGRELPGATGSSLLLPAVQPDSSGLYSVVVADDYRSVTSAPATLIVLVAPTIVQQPVSQSVVPGARVVLSVTVTNTASLPLTVVWRRNGASFVTNSVNARTAFLVLTNAQPTFNLYLAVVSNPARTTGLSSSGALLTFVSDLDGDGMPDSYETAFFNGDTAGDPNADPDGDKMSNLAEYLAGTDPVDPTSFLDLTGTRVTGGAALKFLARGERTYTVEYREGWEGTVWRKLADVGAQATNHFESIQDPAPTTNRFYRVVTPRQP